MRVAFSGSGGLLAVAMFLCGLLSPAPSRSAELRAVAVIPPLQFLLDRVAGAAVTSSSLVDGGRDPHSFEPTMRQIADLAGADLYVSGNLEFERGFRDKLVATSPRLTVVAPPAAIPRLAAADHDAEEGEDAHHHQDADTHLWMSPANAKLLAAAIAGALADRDPGNADTYRGNLARLHAELDGVDARIRGELAPHRGKTFYVYHPAFAYFARDYGLVQKAVEAGGRAPSPKQLARLIERARGDRVRIIFVQPQFDRVSAETLAGSLGAAVVPLDVMAYDLLANFRLIAERLRQAFETKP
ncbi:MAG: zinc ABC transporter substrate-binding protein [Thermodesulfobacteriota bacterium]